MKKGFIIFAVVLVAVGITVFGAAFIASGFDFSKLETAKYETNTYTPGEDFKTIEIKSEEADITFKPSEDKNVRVDCVERTKVKHKVSVENGRLKIITDDKREWYDHITFFSFKPQSVTVYLPSAQYAALTVAANTGDISVPNRFSFGEAQIKTSTGKVIFGATVEEGLKIKTSTGNIEVSGISADTVDLSASTGEIRVKKVNCKDKLSVKVGTGITYLTDIACKSFISAGSTGDVKLKNAVAYADMNIKRNTGDVRFENCDAKQITVKTSTGDVTGTLRTEKVFITKSSTGEIKVPDTDIGGRCEITTSTGDIEIDLIKQ